MVFREKFNNLIRRISRGRQKKTLNISPNGHKCLILLLKQPLSMTQLMKAYYGEDLDPKRIKSRSGAFKRDAFDEIENFIKKKIKEEKITEKITRKDKRYKIIDVDWNELFTIMKSELPFRLNLTVRGYKFSDALSDFIIDNRSFIFDLEMYKPLLYIKNKWLKRSVIGFIYMALAYFYHTSAVAQRSRTDSQMIKNLRALLDMRIANYYGWDKALKINDAILNNLQQAYDKVFNREEIDLRPFRNFFNFTISYHIKDYRGKHIQANKIISNGITFWLQLRKIGLNNKIIAKDTYTGEKIKIVPYNLQIPELDAHFNTIRKLTELFR